MTTDAEDRSTWPRNDQVIGRDELLRLIEENGGPLGLDLRGAFMVRDEHGDDLSAICIDLSPETLLPLAREYRQANGGSEPPWFVGDRGITLYGALLQGARLAGARLQGAVLVSARLQGAFLVGAQLRGAVFVGAELRRVDMYEVETLDGAHWHGAFLDHTRIKRESLGKAIGDEIDAREKAEAEAYHDAKEAYLLLKNNFNQIGRYEDASWAYVKERQMEKMARYQQHRWWIWPLNRWMPKSWKSWWHWLLAWATEALTKYGQDPWRPIVWAVGLAVGLFPLLFWVAGNLHYQDGTSITAYWDAISYSLTTFGTLSFNDLQPVGIATRIISAIEAFTGVLLFALLVFTLGNRMSRG